MQNTYFQNKEGFYAGDDLVGCRSDGFFHISQALSILRCGRAVGTFCAGVNGERFADCFFVLTVSKLTVEEPTLTRVTFLVPFA